METLITSTYNVANITQCIAELVSNSLNAGATSIAIRIHRKERKIQVIDNGKGITKKDLETTAVFRTTDFDNYSNVENICYQKKQTLANIRKVSDVLIISSRHYNSSKTYMKVFKVYQKPKMIKIQKRPSQGTTVSIYGFHELSLIKWDISFLYKLIANIAIANIQASFTVRDDDQMKVSMIITKQHNPIDLLELLYKKEVLLRKIWCIRSVENQNMNFCIYIGLSNSKTLATQHIFLNNKTVQCPLILQIVSATFINALKCFQRQEYKQMTNKGGVFILLFVSCKEYIFTIENNKRILILPKIQSLLHDIRNQIINVFVEDIVPLSLHNFSKKYRSLCIHYKNRVKVHNSHRNISHLHKLLSRQSSYIYDTPYHINGKNVTEITNNSQEKFKNNALSTTKDVLELFTATLQTNKINKKIITPTISEWSNWTIPESIAYNLISPQHGCNANQNQTVSLRFYKRFDFLPEKLHKLLQRTKTKLIKTDVLNENGSVLSNKLKFGLKNTLLHQDVNIRLCKSARQFDKFILSKEDLKFIKVLGQINNELIAGLLLRNNIKILLLMDQHAIHERIRYEHLLNKYKSEISNGLYCVKLKDPIVIQLSASNYNLVLLNEMILRKFGIIFNDLNNGIIMIHTVPECLRKDKYQHNELKLTLNIKNLLHDLLQSIINYGYSQINSVPCTIQNAIAMEACHGAIKFGDPLTLKECQWLMKLLNETKSPTRCAHGRPSIIPLLELTDFGKQQKNTVKNKLNFGTLKFLRKKKT